MARQSTSSRGLKAIVGATLLALGLLLLIANLDGVAARLSNGSFTSPAASSGTLIELGLAGLRAAQSYVFDHPSFLSGLQQILVSFWPLILVILGIALLGQLFGERLSAYENNASLQAYGDRS
ncbi:MAG TPA: hypothetical protein VH114_07400 [Candidatus Acidoferrum sp.]|jgi:uncharacterized integral membrane protein|nr:hypothetical protein [Candidatus Acidoferrum sp.]